MASRPWGCVSRRFGYASRPSGYEKWPGPGRPGVSTGAGLCEVVFGGVLLSHNPSVAVPSALSGLASGFGMGPGVPHDAITTETL